MDTILCKPRIEYFCRAKLERPARIFTIKFGASAMMRLPDARRIPPSGDEMAIAELRVSQ